MTTLKSNIISTARISYMSVYGSEATVGVFYCEGITVGRLLAIRGICDHFKYKELI